MKAKKHAVRWIGFGMLWLFLTTAFFGCGQTSGEELFFSSSEEAVTEEENGENPDVSTEGGIVVYVCGSVKNAGVYSLAENARVCAAIEAAGGFSKKADQTALNLARVLTDGEMIFVPSKEDSSGDGQTSEASGGQTGSGTSSQTGSTSSDGKVNINRADAAELATVTGIGPTRAEKIIEDRNANGPFSSVQEITRVSGIGETLYQNMKDEITVE